jgi:hypothetical protein
VVQLARRLAQHSQLQTRTGGASVEMS